MGHTSRAQLTNNTRGVPKERIRKNKHKKKVQRAKGQEIERLTRVCGNRTAGDGEARWRYNPYICTCIWDCFSLRTESDDFRGIALWTELSATRLAVRNRLEMVWASRCSWYVCNMWGGQTKEYLFVYKKGNMNDTKQPRGSGPVRLACY